jgi:hypothetical protein
METTEETFMEPILSLQQHLKNPAQPHRTEPLRQFIAIETIQNGIVSESLLPSRINAI